MPLGMFKISAQIVTLYTYSIKLPFRTSKTSPLFSIEEHLIFCPRLLSVIWPRFLSSTLSHYIKIWFQQEMFLLEVSLQNNKLYQFSPTSMNWTITAPLFFITWWFHMHWFWCFCISHKAGWYIKTLWLHLLIAKQVLMFLVKTNHMVLVCY